MRCRIRTGWVTALSLAAPAVTSNGYLVALERPDGLVSVGVESDTMSNDVVPDAGRGALDHDDTTLHQVRGLGATCRRFAFAAQPWDNTIHARCGLSVTGRF